MPPTTEELSRVRAEAAGASWSPASRVERAIRLIDSAAPITREHALRILAAVAPEITPEQVEALSPVFARVNAQGGGQR